jgi:CIC family chloride channel protein
MGAVLAGTTHASVSAVLIIFELTGDYGVILPLMLSCVISAAVSRRIEPSSLYTAVLRKRNVQIPVGAAPPWLQPVTVADLAQGEPAVIAPHAPLEEVVARFLELAPGKNLYVVDASGLLTGVLAVDDLKGHLPHYRLLQSAVASELAMPATPIRRDASLAEAARAFGETALEELPVVDERRRLVGTLSKSTLLAHGVF